MILNNIKLAILTVICSLNHVVFAQVQHEVNQVNGQTDTEEVSNIDSIYFSLPNSEMHIRMVNGNLMTYPWSELINMTFSGSPIGQIDQLDCASATVTGSVVDNTPVTGINLELAYTGGNGGSYTGEVVSSTGVTGLTATLSAGTFAMGAGTLTYELQGTANNAGVALFNLNVGGESCTVEVIVDPSAIGEIDQLDCQNATLTGNLEDGVAAANVSFDVAYTGGNGGTHNGQVVTSTGVTGLTATLPAGNFATGNGVLTYSISGTPNGSGPASFALDIGGQTCEVSFNVSGAGCPTLAIGDVFGGGVVIEVNYPGAPCGYLILREDNDDNAYTFDITNTNCFDPPITTPNPPTLSEIGDGTTNSQFLVNNCINTPAEVCENATHGGFNDWFLPSKDEVIFSFDNWTSNNFGSDKFFSSTFEYQPGIIMTPPYANYIMFHEPGVTGTTTYTTVSTNAVRCVRSF